MNNITTSLKQLLASFIILVVAAVVTIIIYDMFIAKPISEHEFIYQAIGIAIVVGFWSSILLFIRRTRNIMAKHIGEQATTLLQIIMVSIAVLIMVFAVLSTLGVSPESLLTGAGFVSITIGLIISTFVGGVLAGALVFATHKLRVGDTVIVNNTPGVVAELTPLVTRIRTDIGIITIPNSAISSGGIIITRLHMYEAKPVTRLPYAVGDRVVTTIIAGEGTVKEISALRTVIHLDSGRELTVLNSSIFSGATTVAKIAAPEEKSPENS